MGDRVEPLVDRARHLGLSAGQRLRHRLHAAIGLALRPQHLAEALFQLVGAEAWPAANSVPRRPDRATAIVSTSSRTKASPPRPTSASEMWKGQSPIVKKIWFMPPRLADSRLYANEERTSPVNHRLISLVNDRLKFVVSRPLTGSFAD